MGRRTSLWKKCLLALCVALASLELMLQAGAVWVACTDRERPVPADDRPSVLCVGDSYTFGVGASDPSRSYPAQLEHALRSQGIELTARNAGLPGQHSRDVLQRLAGQLGSSTRAVCVLVGTNDTWRMPPVLSLDDALAGGATGGTSHSFRLEWRTGKLLQLITRFRWFSWLRRAPDENPADVMQRDVGYSLAARELGVDLPEHTAARARDPLAPSERRLGSVHEAMGSGAYDVALTAAEAMRAEAPRSPRTLALAAIAAARSGRRDLASTIVLELEKLDTAEESAVTGDALCEAYANTGRPEAMVQRGKKHVAAFPESLEGWDGLQRACFELGLDQEARGAMRATFRLLGRSHPLRTGHMLRNYARLLHKEQPAHAARVLVAAHLIDGDVAATRVVLPIVADTCPRTILVSELDAIRLPDVGRAAALRALLDPRNEQDSWKDVLATHLESIASMARSRGTQPVLLSYPFHNPDLESVLEATALRLSIPFVNPRLAFEKELASCQWSDLFVSDGHCSDRGYALLAREAAAVLAPLLRN